MSKDGINRLKEAQVVSGTSVSKTLNELQNTTPKAELISVWRFGRTSKNNYESLSIVDTELKKKLQEFQTKFLKFEEYREKTVYVKFVAGKKICELSKCYSTETSTTSKLPEPVTNTVASQKTSVKLPKLTILIIFMMMITNGSVSRILTKQQNSKLKH